MGYMMAVEEGDEARWWDVMWLRMGNMMAGKEEEEAKMVWL